jgi:hypothetical protein
MNIFIALVVAALVTALTAVAQDARDIASQMGADTTTSISQGTDRYGVHEDTERLNEQPQHAPNLLGSKGKKLSKTERKYLLQKRQSLLKDRKAYSQAAVVKVKNAKTAAKGRNLSFTNKQETVNENQIRTNAQSEWDATTHGKELQSIERELREGSGGSEVRLYAPSLVKPK